MIRQVGTMGLVVSLAGGLPYLASTANKSPEPNPTATPLTAQSDAAFPSSAPSSATLPLSTSGLGIGHSGQHALAGSPRDDGSTVVPLAEALRFDISPAWLFSRWPRVTSALADLEQQGYRVSLVSGMRADDVAGALTYYFNKKQQVTRITLEGSTGDPTQLIALVSGQYQLKRQMAGDPSTMVFQTRWNGKPVSSLELRPTSVVRASMPNARYHVSLVLVNGAAK